MRFEQQRDRLPISMGLLQENHLEDEQIVDALLSLVTLRYTQSNSVALVHNGICFGIGAGQQSRVDCVRLAAAKARTWWLRRHPKVRELNRITGMTRQDRLNWQIRFAEGAMTSLQLRDFALLFGPRAVEDFRSKVWRETWLSSLTGVTLTSDGFLPFRDSVDYASEVGVTTIIEPGGSMRTAEVRRAALELNIKHVETGLRLFHH
jgi:phosphoribosylaminoimidazolecarboxamide formyltransferase / IMP cyclohydrolase